MMRFFRSLGEQNSSTDDEYVETLRRRIEISRRYGIWLLPSFVIFIWAVGCLAEAIRSMIPGAAAWVGNQNNDLFDGFLMGLIFGPLLAGILHQHSTVKMNFAGTRSLNLMLKYYDMLRDLGWSAESLSQRTTKTIWSRLAARKFLGLPLMRKAMTDSEYVEKMRRSLEKCRRYGKWFITLTTLVSLFVLYGICRIGWVFQGLGGVGGNRFIIGYFAGLVVGTIAGFALLRTIISHQQMIMALLRDRTSELAVRYHDLLLAVAREEVTTLSPEQAGQGGGGKNAEQ